jgi:iron uptake system EfeUOB component EfeO/EfeM
MTISKIAQEQERYRKTLHATRATIGGARHGLALVADLLNEKVEDLAQRVSKELGAITADEWEAHLKSEEPNRDA